MRKRFLQESGVALLMVMGSLLILSTAIVEFAYNTHIASEMAATERDRLKAYYLGKSALNYSRLELRVEKQLRSQFAGILSDLQGTGVSSDPLCKIFPFSSDFLAGIVSGDINLEEGAAEEEKSEKQEEPKEPEEKEDLFELGGSFEVSCDTEERKINLNAFRTESEEATSPIYDEQKILLYSLLTQKNFEPFFDGPDKIKKVVNAIADWADADDRVDEAPGVKGSFEDSEYSSPDQDYKIKNGKYTSVAELLLVSGIGDDIYRELAPHVTVFGDDKINLCQAPDELVRAFVIRYSQTTEGIAPIAATDEERMFAVIEAVRLACDVPSPQPQQVANAITSLVGTGSRSTNIASQITTTNRFYSINATGIAGDARVRFSAVIDTENQNPNLWKTLYFRVQ